MADKQILLVGPASSGKTTVINKVLQANAPPAPALPLWSGLRAMLWPGQMTAKLEKHLGRADLVLFTVDLTQAETARLLQAMLTASYAVFTGLKRRPQVCLVGTRAGADEAGPGMAELGRIGGDWELPAISVETEQLESTRAAFRSLTHLPDFPTPPAIARRRSSRLSPEVPSPKSGRRSSKANRAAPPGLPADKAKSMSAINLKKTASRDNLAGIRKVSTLKREKEKSSGSEDGSKKK